MIINYHFMYSFVDVRLPMQYNRSNAYSGGWGMEFWFILVTLFCLLAQ